MKKVLKVLAWIVGLALFGFACVEGFKYWQVRPWRVIASVNGHSITAKELEPYAVSLMEDMKRSQGVFIPKGKEKDALKGFRREATAKWIMREVLLSEAVARGHEVTNADKKEIMARSDAKLQRYKKITLEQYMKEGPLPEELKRKQFDEGMLISKLVRKEVEEKIQISGQAIDEEQRRLQLMELLAAKSKDKAPPKVSRKQAVESLHNRLFFEGFRLFFREVFPKAQVTCPEYPEMEDINGLSLAHPRDLAPANVAAPAPKDNGPGSAGATPPAAAAPAKPAAAPAKPAAAPAKPAAAPAKPAAAPAKPAAAPEPAKKESK